MKYVCMGFIDLAKLDAVPPEQAEKLREEAFAYDDELRRGGHFVGGEALDSPRNAVTLRMKSGEVEVTDGPFVETKESLGGFLVLEARDLNHAIGLMSKHPAMRLYGVSFEIRPVDEEMNRMVDERNAAFAAKG